MPRKPSKLPKKPPGCPPVPIDWKKVDDLLMSGCLGTEIASYFGIHPETFYLRVQQEKGVGFSEYMHQKRAKGESILRAHQYAKALGLTDKGDNTLLVWLGKNRLKQSDNPQELEMQGEALDKYLKIMTQLDSLQSPYKTMRDEPLESTQES